MLTSTARFLPNTKSSRFFLPFDLIPILTLLFRSLNAVSPLHFDKLRISIRKKGQKQKLSALNSIANLIRFTTVRKYAHEEVHLVVTYS